MDRAEKVMLILKAKFNSNVDILNSIDSIIQLKRPEILLSHEERVFYEEYAEEWFEKGWIIWTGKKFIEEEEEETE